MKSDINLTLNKLISYALDNLLLDALDETYTLNRLASACGFSSPVRDEDADYGDATLETLLAELAAAAPKVDATVIADILFPMPRTVNYYFSAKLARDVKKGVDFLFDLYAHGYKNLSQSPALTKNGYACYYGDAEIPMRAATLNVGEELVYTPRVLGNHIAALENRDIMSNDVATKSRSRPRPSKNRFQTARSKSRFSTTPRPHSRLTALPKTPLCAKRARR